VSTTDGSGSSLALDERTRLLLGNPLDVVIQYDPVGTVLWASPSLRTTFGWDPATITGTQFRLSPEVDRARVEAPIIQARDEGRDVGVVRMRARCLDGSERWVDVTSRLLRDPDGSVEGALATMRDVTEQVEAEAALAESERRYRMVAENASDVVLRVALDDTYTWVSPSARTVFGWDPAQVVGRSGGEFVHPDDLARMRYERTLAHAGPTDYELYRIRHADGDYRWASARSTPSPTRRAGRRAGRRHP
jgi:PAS domain S-box-containing protein